MYRPRIIPVLLLKGNGLVKTVEFRKPTYIGDPINAVHIFNDLKADELIFLDISATPEKRKLDLELIRNISDEAYMPFAIGGNIQSEQEARECFNAGAEKVVLNSITVVRPELVQKVASLYGNQSVVASIDVKKSWLGKYQVVAKCGKQNTKIDPVAHAKKMEELGAGEIMINSIDRDGMMKGYDIQLVKMIADAVNIPVIACGGAGTHQDLAKVITEGNASAAAAGSLFVYHGPRKGILVNYPQRDELRKLFEHLQ